MDITLLKEELARDEGRRERMYLDANGNWTIGVGHNLSAHGLSPAAIDLILEEDIKEHCDDLADFLPWWPTLSNNRQRALANMCFNLGIGRLMEFRRMLKAIEIGDYEQAADEMANSLWAKQVGNRALRLEEMMRFG